MTDYTQDLLAAIAAHRIGKGERPSDGKHGWDKQLWSREKEIRGKLASDHREASNVKD